MTRAGKRNLVLVIAAFFGGLLIAFFMAREPTQPLTHEALQAARRQWEESRIRDYTLRYRMHGSEYRVDVRDGIVTRLQVDGRAATSADVRLYTMDGLFETLEMELENAADPAGPLAEKNGPIIMRVRFHAGSGYLERYVRSGGRSGRGVAIELIELTPTGTTNQSPS